MSRTHPKATLAAEPLEAREVPATVGVVKQAVLDFDGAFVTSAEFAEGRWSLPSQGVSGFRDLFAPGAPAFLDANQNGVINGADADLVLTRVHARVLQDYDAYHLQVFLGDVTTHRPKLTDADKGDVLVLITGGGGGFVGPEFAGVFGVAPVDHGNKTDEIAFVFGG